MNNNKMPLNEYWIWTSYIKKDSSSLSIPLYHYDGFVVTKEIEQKNKDANKDRIEGEPITVIVSKGNPDGKCGNLEIDKKTKVVTSFKLWE